MSVSLPSDKLTCIQQLALSWLETQQVTVCQVMSFLDKANSCASCHLQLQQLCHVIQSDMLTVFHSVVQLLSSVQFFFSTWHQLQQLFYLQQSPPPWPFLLPNVIIVTDATPSHWAFSYSGFWITIISLWILVRFFVMVHIALQELQALAMMLHRMSFQLLGKVVSLHLDNCADTVYLCNQGCTVSRFLPRLACQILSLTDKHVIAVIPAYIPTRLCVEANYLLWGQLLQDWHLLALPKVHFSFGVYQR